MEPTKEQVERLAAILAKAHHDSEPTTETHRYIATNLLRDQALALDACEAIEEPWV